MPSIAENVWLYIKGKPYLQEALGNNIINYSALAREIRNEMTGASFEAIKAALIRINKKLARDRKSFERRIKNILRKSKMEIKNKIAVVISKERLRIPCIAVAKGPSAYTHIIEEEYLERMENKKVILEKNMSLITIISPEEIATTPGVLSYFLSFLAAENINVVEFFSCYKDSLLVFREADTLKAFEILSERMKS
jgi:aspartokinase